MPHRVVAGAIEINGDDGGVAKQRHGESWWLISSRIEPAEALPSFVVYVLLVAQLVTLSCQGCAKIAEQNAPVVGT
jgi:hypothetical protein